MRNLKDIKARAFPRTAPERRADCFSVPLHRRALARVPEIARDYPRLPEIPRDYPRVGRRAGGRGPRGPAQRARPAARQSPRPCRVRSRRRERWRRTAAFLASSQRSRQRSRGDAHAHALSGVHCSRAPRGSRGALNPRPREDGLPRRPTSHPRGVATSSRAETRQETVRSPQDRPRPRSSSATMTLPALETLVCTAWPPRPPVVGQHSQGEDELHRARQGGAPEIARDRSRDCAEIALEISLRGHLRDASSTRVHRR